MALAVEASTSLPNGLQPRPTADTRRPERPSLRNCTTHQRKHLFAETTARLTEHLRRGVTAMTDNDDVVQPQLHDLNETLGDLLGRTDDAEAIDELVRERCFVTSAARGV